MMTKNENNENIYAKAATAYQNAYVSNISGFEIIVELYKGMIGNIEQAKLAYQAGQLDKMCRLNEKTIRILIALQTHLDLEKGGDAAEFLNKFYTSVFASLSKILRNQDPAGGFDLILASLHPLYERWCEFASTQNTSRK